MKTRWDRLAGSLRHPVTEWRVQSAKRAFRKKFPDCAVCGVAASFFGRGNDVHHREPVHVCPEKACLEENLITMCRLHHWLVGHGKDWKAWNDSLRRKGKVGDVNRLRKEYEQIKERRVKDEAGSEAGS